MHGMHLKSHKKMFPFSFFGLRVSVVRVDFELQFGLSLRTFQTRVTKQCTFWDFYKSFQFAHFVHLLECMSLANVIFTIRNFEGVV